MFFSKNTGGFYSTEFHGARTIAIIRPGWEHPLIDVVLQPGESIASMGRFVLNDTEEAMTVQGVPDPSITVPTVEIDNPECKIPADAVEISDVERAALLAGEAAGKLIVADDRGFPVLQDPPALTHDQLVAQTLTQAREERQPIIGVLDGLQASSLAKSDSATALAIEQVKQSLRDITKVDLSTCTTADEMRAAVLMAYGSIVKANPSLATAFREVLQ